MSGDSKKMAMRVRATTKDMYRYIVVLSVKNLEALEELIVHMQDNDYLLLDLEERIEYKRLKQKESTR